MAGSILFNYHTSITLIVPVNCHASITLVVLVNYYSLVNYHTSITLVMLVLPATPSGTPAVKTTLSPCFT